MEQPWTDAGRAPARSGERVSSAALQLVLTEKEDSVFGSVEELVPPGDAYLLL